MITHKKHLLACTFVCSLLFGGCAPTHAATQQPPTTAATPAGLPTGAPWLCDQDGGRWCFPCATCPQGDSGFLCCSGGACLPNVAQNDCPGIWGWCSDYTTSKSCTEDGYCVDKAECHDE